MQQPNTLVFTYIDIVAETDAKPGIRRDSTDFNEEETMQIFLPGNGFIFDQLVQLFSFHREPFLTIQYVLLLLTLRLKGESIINFEELRWLVGRIKTEKEKSFAEIRCVGPFTFLCYFLALAAIIFEVGSYH